MMKVYDYSLILLVVFINCSRNVSDESTALNKMNPVGNYGKNIELNTVTSIDQLLTNPEAYIEKKVLIEGIISAVCPMRGCWIDVTSTESDSELRLKVTDGEIVSPLPAEGKLIKAQGIFQKLELTHKQAVTRKIHFAKEKGVTLHPDSVHITTKDLTSYRMYISGAAIY